MAALEETFGVPVVEAYGMTEAAHQMASNPLPPGKRIPGLGRHGGGTRDRDHGCGRRTFCRRGELGEVVIRGRDVTAGYENNPAANAAAFTNGWFRTGDQGFLDEAGYLRLTGRLKELINRGGEKISPIEVDIVLLDHPAVAQCLTFAMPHAMLGEEVAAAIVLVEGSSAADHELRAFVSERLAQFKVPRKFVFLQEIPKGATGKLQRIGLAEKLGINRVKIGIFGAGAIGGFLGARLAAAGADVTFIARGPHLAAMQANGVRLISGGDTVTVHPRCLSEPAEAGVQDYVVVTLKAHSLPAAAPQHRRA